MDANHGNIVSMLAIWSPNFSPFFSPMFNTLFGAPSLIINFLPTYLVCNFSHASLVVVQRSAARKGLSLGVQKIKYNFSSVMTVLTSSFNRAEGTFSSRSSLHSQTPQVEIVIPRTIKSGHFNCIPVFRRTHLPIPSNDDRRNCVLLQISFPVRQFSGYNMLFLLGRRQSVPGCHESSQLIPAMFSTQLIIIKLRS